VDGVPVDPGRTLTYQGMMFDGVPNLAWSVGYTNQSWTLRADLIALYVCRLLGYMDRHGYTECVPRAGAAAAGEGRPLLDLNSGYIKRAAAGLPKQGRRKPWRLTQNYLLDVAALRFGRLDDANLRFGTRTGGYRRQERDSATPVG
jgi:hypothetical protein